MAKNVRFVRTTKEKWLTRDTYDPLALYFCEDTQEMCKGDKVLTDGVRIVSTKADLPSCPCAADGVVYYVTETRNGYVMAPDRSGWLQTIYAPATDAYTVPESEIYNTVTTVGAVRDIENAIYDYIDKEIASVEGGGGSISGLNPADGTITITDTEDGGKAVGVAISTEAGNALIKKNDGLYVEKAVEEDTFGNVITTIACGGIEAGTSLKGKTIKDVLIMLLGIKEAPKSAVDYIVENNIPSYSGLEGEDHTEVAYQQLDTATAEYTDQGFYTTTNDKGEITNAGYQMVFKENTEGVAQTFAICATAKIVTAYQYQPALNQWLDMNFDGTYWVENGTVTEVINGQEVTYTTYIYNEELMGDVITAPEYWRFEVEVL